MLTIPSGRIRPSWNTEAMLIKGVLTDKKIEDYRKRGFYTADWKEARKQFWKNKEAARKRVHGNFVEAEDGRLIYSPL